MARIKMLDQFRAARRAGCPLVVIKTLDPMATVLSIADISPTPVIQWDCIRGFAPANDPGKKVLEQAKMSGGEPLVDPVWAHLQVAQNLPAKTILFVVNAHLFLKEREFQQALWNLRDTFKTDQRMVILLYPDAELPSTIEKDVIVLEEPYPTGEEIDEIFTAVYAATKAANPKLPDLKPTDIANAQDGLVGLSHFQVETVSAMAISKDGINFEMMWEQKRQVINSTRGLQYWEPREADDIENLVGIDNAVRYMKRLADGNAPFALYVIADEVEKGFAGAGTDTSGSTTKQLGTFCTWMENNEIPGITMVGVPGMGKTQLGKAIARYANKPCLMMSFADMEGSHVGDTNLYTSTALKVIDAMRQGKRVCIIATSNNAEQLPPELRRRLGKLGTIFFDFLTAAGRAACWPIYLEKYRGIMEAAGKGRELFTINKKNPLPKDDDWTGAEIRDTCERAWMLNSTLEEAAAYTVPVATMAKEKIERLRRQASGRYISASEPGLFNYEDGKATVVKKGDRAVQFNLD